MSLNPSTESSSGEQMPPEVSYALIEFALLGLSATGGGLIEENIAHLAMYQPALKADVLASIESLSDDRRYLWSNTLNIYSFASSDSRDLTSIEKSLRNWMRIIDFTEVLYPLDEDCYTETDISNTIYSVGNLASRGEDYRVLIALMLMRRDGQFKYSGKGMDQDRADEVRFIVDNIEAILPLVPELMERRDASWQMMQTLLRAESVPLRGGLL